MPLTVRILENLVNVNTYDYTNAHRMYAGTESSVYFQLVDPTKDRGDQGYKPEGRRYIPASGATMTVTLDSLDSSKKITDRTVVQPFPSSDPSIWQLELLTTDTIVGTTNLRFTLTEGSVVKCGRLEAALVIDASIC